MSRALRLALFASAAAHGAAAMALYSPWPSPSRLPILEARLLAPAPISVQAQATVGKRVPTISPPGAPSRSEPARAREHSQPPAAVPLSPGALPDARSQAGPPSASPEVASQEKPAGASPAPAAQEPPRYQAAYLSNPPPAYPPSARRRGIEGTVLLDTRVGPAGETREVRVAASAGDAALDAAALEAVREWRFEPARRGSLAVEAWVRIPVVFRLN